MLEKMISDLLQRKALLNEIAASIHAKYAAAHAKLATGHDLAREAVLRDFDRTERPEMGILLVGTYPGEFDLPWAPVDCRTGKTYPARIAVSFTLNAHQAKTWCFGWDLDLIREIEREARPVRREFNHLWELEQELKTELCESREDRIWAQVIRRVERSMAN